MSPSPRMPPDVAAAVDSCRGGRGPLKAQCLLSDGDFSSAVAAEGGAAARVEMISRDLRGPFVHCGYSVARDGASGTLHSLQQGGRVLLFGEGGRLFDIALRAVRRLQPGVMAPFTESAAIRGILEGLEESAGVSLRHKRSVKKRTAGAMPRTVLDGTGPPRAAGMGRSGAPMRTPRGGAW